MLRKILTTLSLIGLLLSVGLWGVSYLQWGIVVHRFALSAFNGGLVLFRVDAVRTDQEIEAIFSYMGTSSFRLGEQCYLFSSSFSITTNWFGLPGRYRNTEGAGIFAPFWLSTVTFGLAFSLCRPLNHHRRRKRKKPGLCLECGYNLRGLTELRCPECNTPFEKCSAKP